MTKKDVLTAFEKDIRNGDPRQGNATIEDIKKTAKRLFVTDRTGVVEALRYWLNLRDIGLTPTALIVIAAVKNISELKPDIENLRAEIESGKVFHPSYLDLADLALKNISGNP